MKYIKKIPQENKFLTEELTNHGWKILKELSNLSTTIAIAMPISIVLMVITGICFGLLFPEVKKFLDADNISINICINLKTVFYLAGILFYTFLHEMIHGLSIPGAIRSEKTFWGINGCFGFAYTEERIKKGRYILVSVMPLLILSFAVPLLCSIFDFYHWYLLLLCIINAGGACVDIFNVLLIAKQVPARGLIVSNGMKTFYRASDNGRYGYE